MNDEFAFVKGSSPQEAITSSREGAGLPSGVRAKLSFATTENETAKILLSVPGVEEVDLSPKGDWTFKTKGKWYAVDEKGLSWADAADMAGMVPEIVGAGVGIATAPVTGPASYPLAVGLAGLGAGLGKATAIEAKPLVGIDSESTPMQDLSSIGESSLQAAAGEAFMRPIIGIGKKLLAPRSAGITPMQMANKVEAEAAGMAPLASDIKPTRTMALVDLVLNNSFGGSNVMRNHSLKQMETLYGMGADLVGETPLGTTAVKGGVASGFATEKAAFKSHANALFDGIGDAAERVMERVRLFKGVAPNVERLTEENLSMEVPVANTIKALDEWLSVPQNKSYSSTYTALSQIRDRMAAGKMPLEQVRGEFTVLGAKGASEEAVNEAQVSIFNHLRGVLKKDTEQWAKGIGGEVYDKYREAQIFYSPKIKIWRGDTGRALKKALEDGGTDRIVQRFFSPEEVSKLGQVKYMVGEDGYNLLSQKFLQSIFEKAKGVTPEGTNFLNFSTIERELSKYGKDFLEKALSKEQLSRIEYLIRLSKTASAGGRLASNPSGTGQLVGGLQLLTAGAGAGVAAYEGDWKPAVAAAFIIGAPYAMAHFVVSGMGRKFLTEGYKIPGVISTGAEVMSTAILPRKLQSDIEEEKRRERLYSPFNGFGVQPNSL